MTATLESYKAYRERAKQLHTKIMHKCLADAPFEIGRLLGIVRGKTFIFESMNEMNAVTDMALHEHRVNNKNAIEVYRETVGWDSEMEKEILDALLSSYVSLFRITAIAKSEHMLLLHDLFCQKRSIELTDIGFSETASVGILLFLRVVPFRDFKMASGGTFVFPSGREESLLRSYGRLSKRLGARSESLKRFASFFWLNRKDGLEVRYE